MIIYPFAADRWEMEIFFNVLMTGCRIEALKLTSLPRIQRALAVFMVVAWRMAHLMRKGQTCPDLAADLMFDIDEIHAAYVLNKKPLPHAPPSLTWVQRAIAGWQYSSEVIMKITLLNVLRAADRASADAQRASERGKAALRRLLCGTSIGIALLVNSTAFAVTYSDEIINVPGAKEMLMTGLNDSGTVVGNWVDGGNVTHGYLYQNGQIMLFDVPNSTSTLVSGVNNAGSIVGSYQDLSFNSHGFVLSQGSYTTLDVPGAAFTNAFAINDKGQVTVSASIKGNPIHNFIYQDGAYTGIPRSGANDVPVAINNAGTVVGTTYVYADGQTTRIKIPDSGLVNATGINPQGTVVGYYFNLPAGGIHGFVIDKGVVKDIVRPGFAQTFTTAINAANAVVGYSFNQDGTPTEGFTLARRKFVPVTPGTDVFPQAINRKGQVAGVVGRAAFLSTPARVTE